MNENASDQKRRSVLPRCLQPSASVQYEVFTRKGRRVEPSLSGYTVSPGKHYEVHVDGSQDSSRQWSVQLESDGRLVEPIGSEKQVNGGRVVEFRVKGYATLALLFANPISEFGVRVHSADQSEPLVFAIPIRLVKRLWLLLPLMSFLLTAVPSMPLRWGIPVSAGIAGALYLICGVRERIRIGHTERHRVAEWQTGIREATGGRESPIAEPS